MIKTRKYILDSGAFTASKKLDKDGEILKIDIDAYIEYVKKHEGLFDYCFNLDVIGDGEASYKNWMKLRKAGVDSIPVYHIGTDEKWLRRYLDKTDYIGLGAIANLATTKRIWGLTRIWEDYLVDQAGYPAVKVHGLGLTAIEIVLKFPWYSVDSASANMAAAFGQVYIPDIMTGEPDYFKLKSIKCSDQGHHVRGIKSYWSYPHIVKKAYEKFFNEHGYQMGSIANKEIRQRRATVLRRQDPAGLDLGIKKLPREDVETLSNSYGNRLFWNYLMWNKMVERLPSYKRKLLEPIKPTIDIADRTSVYIVITSSKKYLLPLMSYYPPLNMLASYYYANDNLIKTLTEHKQMKL